MSEPPMTSSLPSYVEVHARCETHGPFSARAVRNPLGDNEPPLVVTRCPLCAAADKVTADARVQQRERSDRARQVRTLLSKCGIPARFVGCTFESYIETVEGQERAKRICQRYADTWVDQLRKGGSLILTGNTGTGKTHLACAIAARIIPEHMATVVFGSVSWALRHVRSTYSKGSTRTEQDAIDDLVEPDLLVLDEMGVTAGSEHEKNLMFDILNERYQALRPTILLSNLTAAQLADFLGARVMDRFRQCGVVLAFDWESHRGSNVA